MSFFIFMPLFFLTMKMLFLSHNNQETQVKEGCTCIRKYLNREKLEILHLKNRLVMSPMGTSLAEMDGSPSEDMIAFYEARAIGGAALIIPEIARVNDLHGAGMMRQLSCFKRQTYRRSCKACRNST